MHYSLGVDTFVLTKIIKILLLSHVQSGVNLSLTISVTSNRLRRIICIQLIKYNQSVPLISYTVARKISNIKISLSYIRNALDGAGGESKIKYTTRKNKRRFLFTYTCDRLRQLR